MLNITFTKKKTKVTDTIKQNLSQKEAQSNLRQYQGIEDLPMDNFRKIIKTGDTRYLYILDNYTVLPEKNINASVFEDIFWEYIEAKGIDQNFKLRLEIKAKIAILENEELFENKKNYTRIELEKAKLKDLEKKTKKNADIENDAILSKFIGFQINPKTTTVLQYIGYENLLTEANNKNDSNNRQKHI
jgi:hypothetical protein